MLEMLVDVARSMEERLKKVSLKVYLYDPLQDIMRNSIGRKYTFYS